MEHPLVNDAYNHTNIQLAHVQTTMMPCEEVEKIDLPQVSHHGNIL